MRIRFIPSLLVFLSAYSPLSIIFLIQDFDFSTNSMKHPFIIWPILGVSFVSCLMLWLAIYFHKSSSPPVKVNKISNRSGELINYSIPYMVSFFVMDLSNIKMLLSFLFFMLIMYCITIKTHNIFINPMLAVIGYNLYTVQYERNGYDCEDFFLVKGERLQKNERCVLVKLSEQLYIVTERLAKE